MSRAPGQLSVPTLLKSRLVGLRCLSITTPLSLKPNTARSPEKGGRGNDGTFNAELNGAAMEDPKQCPYSDVSRPPLVWETCMGHLAELGHFHKYVSCSCF